MLIRLMAVLLLQLLLLSASACEYFYRADGRLCADSCIDDLVNGICPRIIPVRFGGLSPGTCQQAGYTKLTGPMSIFAGPCLRMNFTKYARDWTGTRDTCQASPASVRLQAERLWPLCFAKYISRT